MDNFTCKSCGATMYIDDGDKPVCAYCQSHLLKKIEPKAPKRSKYYVVIVALLLIAAGAIYIATVKSTSSQPDPVAQVQPVAPKPEKKEIATESASDMPVETLETSYIDLDKHAELNAKMTPWMRRDVYQKKYSDEYFKQNNTYPIYIETDVEGNIRVLIVNKEITNWHYVAFMEQEDLKRFDARYKAKGYRILSLFVLDQKYFKTYAACWVRKSKWNQETKKLLDWGIHPPQALQKDNNG